MAIPSFTISKGQDNRFGSNRYVAVPVRRELEEFLRDHDNIIIDFEGVPDATQSWVDELIGKLVLREGKALLDRVQFKNCTLNLQELIKFVVTDRMRDHKNIETEAPSTYGRGLSGTC